MFFDVNVGDYIVVKNRNSGAKDVVYVKARVCYIHPHGHFFLYDTGKYKSTSFGNDYIRLENWDAKKADIERRDSFSPPLVDLGVA